MQLITGFVVVLTFAVAYTVQYRLTVQYESCWQPYNVAIGRSNGTSAEIS